LVSQMIAVEDERIAVLRELTFGLSGDHSIFLLESEKKKKESME